MASEVQCVIFHTGYCQAWEHQVIAGGEHRRVPYPLMVALFWHPRGGWVLWDTGLAPRIMTATQHFPYSLYRKAVTLQIDAELSVVAQLPRWGLSAKDISWVIVSHFHADHIAGLRDFPHARILASQQAYDQMFALRGLSAVRRAFLPSLLPNDLIERLFLITHFMGPDILDLGPSYDLFGDQTFLLMPLPGHARGQLGLLADTQQEKYLFVADAAWLRKTIFELRPPLLPASFVLDDVHAMWKTLQKLHSFSQLRPEVQLIPSHCPETLADVLKQQESIYL